MITTQQFTTTEALREALTQYIGFARITETQRQAARDFRRSLQD